MINFLDYLDDDNDFDHHSQNRKPLMEDPELEKNADLDEDLIEEDFDEDELEQANDGGMDSEYDRDIESENSDDNNF